MHLKVRCHPVSERVAKVETFRRSSGAAEALPCHPAQSWAGLHQLLRRDLNLLFLFDGLPLALLGALAGELIEEK